MAACKSGPRAKTVDELGGDIEVLRLPQACSLPFLSGCWQTQTQGIAETEVDGVELVVGSEKSALGSGRSAGIE